MAAKQKKFGSLNEYTRTRSLNPHLIKGITTCLAYTKDNMNFVFDQDFTTGVQNALNDLLGEDLLKHIQHPFNTKQLTVKQKVLGEDYSFFESDRGLLLLRHFRHEFELLHKLYTVKLLFTTSVELNGNTDITHAVKHVESWSANSMIGAFEVLSRHMNILQTDGKLTVGKPSIFLLLDQLKFEPRDYEGDVKEYFGDRGYYFICEMNKLLLNLAMSHAVRI